MDQIVSIFQQAQPQLLQAQALPGVEAPPWAAGTAADMSPVVARPIAHAPHHRHDRSLPPASPGHRSRRPMDLMAGSRPRRSGSSESNLSKPTPSKKRRHSPARGTPEKERSLRQQAAERSRYVPPHVTPENPQRQTVQPLGVCCYFLLWIWK